MGRAHCNGTGGKIGDDYDKSRGGPRGREVAVSDYDDATTILFYYYAAELSRQMSADATTDDVS